MVTLATGRMFLSALPYAEELGIDSPLITYHGALIKQAGSGQIPLKHCPVLSKWRWRSCAWEKRVISI